MDLRSGIAISVFSKQYFFGEQCVELLKWSGASEKNNRGCTSTIPYNLASVEEGKNSAANVLR